MFFTSKENKDFADAVSIYAKKRAKEEGIILNDFEFSCEQGLHNTKFDLKCGEKFSKIDTNMINIKSLTDYIITTCSI